MRTSLLATFAVAGALAAAVVAPAVSNAADTVVTFTVAGGALNITAPANQTLTVTGNQATGGITPVVVSDQRRGINGWTASAVSTAFTKPAPDPASIPATAVTYQGSLPAVTGVAIVTPSLLPVVLDTTKSVQVATAVVGANTATWTGNVTVTLPNDVVAGVYTGTITHSVA
ncbi:hypothetical protein [Rhodococcoides kyotonense]|uniref:WxL domain surface cell wall-binding n=1 Tax=Rhodococcoides kyotonense TaxID=398843 RepID=A0A239EKE9_9NOCA|nr:hypothetical protein [Rhodococcus kyotonensis]SNS44344.1 hypothetical protein SAMN05421642_102401 [Rhodococcus kyotonensis]